MLKPRQTAIGSRTDFYEQCVPFFVIETQNVFESEQERKCETKVDHTIGQDHCRHHIHHHRHHHQVRWTIHARQLDTGELMTRSGKTTSKAD